MQQFNDLDIIIKVYYNCFPLFLINVIKYVLFLKIAREAMF